MFLSTFLWHIMLHISYRGRTREKERHQLVCVCVCVYVRSSGVTTSSSSTILGLCPRYTRAFQLVARASRPVQTNEREKDYSTGDYFYALRAYSNVYQILWDIRDFIKIRSIFIKTGIAKIFMIEYSRIKYNRKEKDEAIKKKLYNYRDCR